MTKLAQGDSDPTRHSSEGVTGNVTALDIAVDSVASFVALIGWVFVVWMLPIFLLALHIVKLRHPHASLLPVVVILLFLLVLLVPLGFLLLKIAGGILLRRRRWIICSAGLFMVWAAQQIHVLIAGRIRHDAVSAYQFSFQSAMFVLVGIILLLGLRTATGAKYADS